MSTSPAAAEVLEEEEGVVLSPEEEAEMEAIIAETDEDFRAGRCITWEQFLAERDKRRAG
jgi:hypothetical protein